VPLLLVKVGPYPLHHGGVGAIRSLGRMGVPVFAITESRFTPAALSRYLTGAVVWPTSGLEDGAELVAALLNIGRRLPGLCLALATDDEAAILLSEHRDELAPQFLIPAVAPGLPRALADKASLSELCAAHGIPSPASFLPASAAELIAGAAKIGYPVIVKNAQPWERLRRPAVGSSTLVADEAGLRSLTRDWDAQANVLVQKFVPGDQSSDWVVNVYCGADSKALVCFTGMKVRCWPPGAGVGSLLYALRNDAIAAMTADLCRKVGYRGVADLDWRRDQRTGTYQLLDFNPRLGAQFQLFRNQKGIDVVRAHYRDMTGQTIPPGPQVYGHGLRVEHLDIPAAVQYRRSGGRQSVRIPRGHTRLAWLAPDDPVPALAASFRAARLGAAMAARRWGQRGAGAAGRNR
jgi:D-aspartate ligase